ncbi:hypothetical protein [Arhodomonas sp. AD133]|uniref:hypothetical protein n=1 Tax=Arhodomonas sp. AD133 TaxID=3415009 RepID=UPI003EB83AF9
MPKANATNTAKPWWASKTLWVNVLALIAAVTGALGIDVGLDAETQTAIVGGIMGVVNIVLRLVTDRPVTVAGG